MSAKGQLAPTLYNIDKAPRTMSRYYDMVIDHDQIPQRYFYYRYKHNHPFLHLLHDSGDAEANHVSLPIASL